MDCIEAIALKSSLRREVSMKSSYQQAFLDDIIWCSTGVSGEDFPIDDLLDFPNEDFTKLEEEEEEEEEKSLENDDTSISTSFSDPGHFPAVPADELAVPVDDLENLEWLSRFVDDSVSEFSLLHPGGKERTGSIAENRSKPGSKKALPMRPVCFPLSIPAKPRTKRSRPAGRVWSLASPSLSESSSSPSPSGSSSPTSCLIFNNSVQTMDLFYGFGKPPAKKQKKKPAVSSGETGGVMQFQRRCSHCQVNKTPQWRTGPLGAKTLCNACGVRFKSGRLYPEYRPACSPTFSVKIHSNSHRKVLEMRRKKEMDEPDSRLGQMVSSC